MLQMAAETYSYTDKNGVTWEGSVYQDYNYNTGSVKNVASINAASGYGEEVVMPDTIYYNDVAYAVTSLDGSVFKNNDTIKKVTLAQGITDLSNETFSGCSSLVAIIKHRTDYSSVALCF